MTLLDQFWYAWPWMGLGGAAVLLILLFGTDLLRSGEGPRRRDPVWLAWAAVEMYLLHQFEEYGLHVTDGQYDIVTQVTTMGLFDLSDLPMAHFPAGNIVLVWVGMALAAWLCRRNPVIGLAPYGFIMVNGLMHVVQTVALGIAPADNPGFFTGAFLFLPVTALVIYACVKGDFMDGRGLAVALGAGVLSHLLLGAAYALCAALGGAAVLAFDVAVSFGFVVFGWLGCKAFRPKVRALGPRRPAAGE
jgi:hypothetical protein